MLKTMVLGYATIGLAVSMWAYNTHNAPEPLPHNVAAVCAQVTNKEECIEVLGAAVACANAGSAALRRECEDK
jgi:hypothetical protein